MRNMPRSFAVACTLTLALLTLPTAPVRAVDPNCTVNVAQGGAINNYFGAPNAQQQRDATNAIAQLDFNDIWRNPPFRINFGTVRLDVQGAINGGGRNWQVQINGVNGNSTISHATIQGPLAGASTADRQAFVQRKMRDALVQSLNSGNSFDVNGNCN